MDLKIALYINEDIPPESQRIICASKILTKNDKLIAELAGNVDKLHLVNLKVTPTTQPPAELAQFGAKLKVDSVIVTTSSNAISPPRVSSTLFNTSTSTMLLSENVHAIEVRSSSSSTIDSVSMSSSSTT